MYCRVASIKGHNSIAESTSVSLISPKIIFSILLAAALLSCVGGVGSATTYDLDYTGGYLTNSYLKIFINNGHLTGSDGVYFPNSSSEPTYNLTNTGSMRVYYFPKWFINNTLYEFGAGTWSAVGVFSWISNNTDEAGNNYSVGRAVLWNSTYSMIQNRTYKFWWQKPIYEVEVTYYNNDSSNSVIIDPTKDNIINWGLLSLNNPNMTYIGQQYATVDNSISDAAKYKKVLFKSNGTFGSGLKYSIDLLSSSGIRNEIPRISGSWYVQGMGGITVYPRYNTTYNASSGTNYTLLTNNKISILGKFALYNGNMTYNTTAFGQVMQDLQPITKPTNLAEGMVFIDDTQLTSDIIDKVSISGAKYIGIQYHLSDISHGVLYNESYQQADPNFNASLALIHSKGMKAILWFSPSGIACNQSNVDPLNTSNPEWTLKTTDGGSTPIYYWSEKYCEMNPWSGWYDWVINKVQNDTNTYTIDGFAFDEPTILMINYYNNTNNESARLKYVNLSNTLFSWLKSQNKTVIINDRFSDFDINLSNVDIMMGEGIGKWGDPTVSFTNGNSYIATNSFKGYYGNRYDGAKYFNNSNWNESIVETSYVYAVDGWKEGWSFLEWYTVNWQQNYSLYTLRAINGNRTNIPPRPADNAWNDFINVTSNYNGELWCLGINRNSSGIWNGTISCDGTTEDSWDIENHKFVQRGTANSINTTVPKYHVLTIRLVNTSSTYFNISQGASKALFTDALGTIDDQVPAQITSSTSATSITFNSSQNYTGTNWQISVVGDLTGKTWKYKAHNDNTWLTVPAANISYNGTHTLFNLQNINVSQASNSNELLGTDTTMNFTQSATDTYNDTDVTISIGYYNSTIEPINTSCFVSFSGTNYSATYSAGLHTYAIETSALNGEYTFGVFCNSTSFNNQYNLSAGSFIVRIGQAGTPTGGSNPSGSYNAPQNQTNVTNTTNSTIVSNTTQFNNITLPKIDILFKENSTLPTLNISYVSINLEKQLKDYSAPAFGWIAPKTIGGHQIYVPNWAFALVIALIVDSLTGIGRRKDSDALDVLVRIIAFVAIFAAVLYGLIYIL